MEFNKENSSSTLEVSPVVIEIAEKKDDVDDSRINSKCDEEIQGEEPQGVKIAPKSVKRVCFDGVTDETKEEEQSNVDSPVRHPVTPGRNKGGFYPQYGNRDQRNNYYGKNKYQNQNQYQYHPHKKPYYENKRKGHGYVREEFPLLEFTDHIQAEQEVIEHFSKSFTFTSSEGNPWILPPPETMYTADLWDDESLLQEKASLNKTKEQLSDKDISKWHQHTTNTNPAQRISQAVKRKARPEMVTQAWLKFYEIVNSYPILENNGEVPEKLNTVHLCEAPGAFILALNHYLAINYPDVPWQWIGNTLNPYYEGTPLEQCITEDRFIFLTLPNWHFGKDDTGDIMSKENVHQLIERTKVLGPIQLVTADGSFDCQGNPAEQEPMTHPLHLCEVLAGMSVLTKGGSLVVKKFTFFEIASVNLMYLLCCNFESVTVYKPATSKQGNSEVYVIAKNYEGNKQKHLELLMKIYGSKSLDKSMFAQSDIPQDFLEQIKECVKQFKGYQVSTIMRNLRLYNNMHEREKQHNELLKSKATAMFFKNNYCEQIIKTKMLTQGDVNHPRNILDSDWQKTWSASLIRSGSNKCKLEHVNNYLGMFISELEEEFVNNEEEPAVFDVSCDSPVLESLELQLRKGKSFQYVESSKFCSEKIIRLFCETHRIYQSINDNKDRNISSEISSKKTFLQVVQSKYPGSKIIQDCSSNPCPKSECTALETVIVWLEEGQQLAEGDNLILVDILLLTRLQYGHLLLISTAFKRIVVYSQGKVSMEESSNSCAPVLVLEGLRSVSAGEAVVRALHRCGWSPAAGAGGEGGLMQVLSFASLVKDWDVLRCIFDYNTKLCLHYSLQMNKYLNDTELKG